MRHEKKYLCEEVTEQITKQPSFVIMSYEKLAANTANEFRTEVVKRGGNVEMMRKRLLIKAADAAGITLDLAQLPGHIGLVFAGDDPIETTKFVFKFSQDNSNTISVIGGRFEGQVYSGADVKKLSQLPGKDEMRAQFLSVLEAPLSQTLAVMEALLSSVVYCLDNKVKESDSSS